MIRNRSGGRVGMDCGALIDSRATGHIVRIRTLVGAPRRAIFNGADQGFALSISPSEIPRRRATLRCAQARCTPRRRPDDSSRARLLPSAFTVRVNSRACLRSTSDRLDIDCDTRTDRGSLTAMRPLPALSAPLRLACFIGAMRSVRIAAPAWPMRHTLIVFFVLNGEPHGPFGTLLMHFGTLLVHSNGGDRSHIRRKTSSRVRSTDFCRVGTSHASTANAGAGSSIAPAAAPGLHRLLS
jgi:hypothetical protein